MPPVVGVGALTEAGRITRLLALDGIQDPGNLGTLVRTALALGWDAVALLPGTCDPYNDKVRDFAPVECVNTKPSDTIVHSIFKPGTARSVTLSGWTPRRPIALPVLYIYFTCETKPSF